MNRRNPGLILLVATLLLAWLAGGPCPAKDLSELRILYVGSERTDDFVAFLIPYVALVESRDRATFKPSDAASFDVVLLDWPQDGKRDSPPPPSPLGKREKWGKPTVLLGSAGLRLAIAWKLKGGSGCTCMSPLAYGLRPSEIFQRPYPIDLGKMVSIPTPPGFKAEIKEPEIQVLPLVDDYQKAWPMGWSTHAFDFPRNPDVEYFCGGVNEQTPTSAGLWRQGNLLHFGFEQSPSQMNKTGQDLLLNSIAYISHFTQDRPIAVTPSVFAGPVAPSRGSILRHLRNPDFYIEWVALSIAPDLWAKIAPPDAINLAATAKNVMDHKPFVMPPAERELMAVWAEKNGPFLHPNKDLRLELDEDLVALGTPFDQPAFFDRTLADLKSSGPAAERARRLLERYVPSGPKNGTPEQWASWWQENKSYVFASDSSDYCWYVDRLAKARGIPSSDLQGPKRADVVASGHL